MAKDVVDESWPDELLDSQWFDRFTRGFFDVPERRLLVAVLVDAARLLHSGFPQRRAGVIAWIRGQPARLPFQDLCDGLELDATRIAHQLLSSDAPARVPRRARIQASRRVQCVGRKPRRVRVAAPTEDDEPRSLSA